MAKFRGGQFGGTDFAISEYLGGFGVAEPLHMRGCGCAGCSDSVQLSIEDDSVIRLRSSEPQEGSVDGQGGMLRGNPVFTVQQAAFQLNRGQGLKTDTDGQVYGSGANWGGAQGEGANGWFFLATSKTNGGEAHDPATQFRLSGGTVLVEPTGPLKEITFGFYESFETLPDPYVFTQKADGVEGKLYVGDARANGFSALSPEQRAATREAFQSWDDLVAIKFTETHFKDGDINFMNTTTGPAQASAFLPYGSSTSSVIIQDDGSRVTTYERNGDVFIATPSKNASNGALDEGQYGLTTLIHEIGHSLGLEHPGNYNFAPGFAVTYDNGADYYQDSNMYTIMSYWDGEETGASFVDWQFLTYRYASTPMVHDVAAIQRIYGADTTTRTDDTTYGFNASADTAGRDSYDFTKTPHPVMTIWDAGGNDTLDLSGFNTPSVIDLNPGAFSSAGGFFSANIPTLDEINARRKEAGLSLRTQATLDQYIALFGYKNSGLMKDNIGIAYGAMIENAKGGAGNDSMLGNDADNVLVGNGGNDVIRGGKGKDTLEGGDGDDILVGGADADKMDGGAGFDILSFRDAAGPVTITIASTGKVTVTGTNDFVGDTYVNIEGFEGSAGNDKLIGGALNDVLFGFDGNDELLGGNGHDKLDGGAGDDRVDGGSGNDQLFGRAGIDTILGGTGNDIIDGGAGADILTGNSGSDMFIFQNAADANGDRITDFVVGLDKIDLSGLFAGDAAVPIKFGTVAEDAAANSIYVYTTGGRTFVVGDNNGVAGNDFSIELTNGARLKESDIVTTQSQWNDFFAKIGSPVDYNALHDNGGVVLV